jgi:hypothetical protein
MLGLLVGPTQLKDATAARDRVRDCGANEGSAKPSYGEERFLGELGLIMR